MAKKLLGSAKLLLPGCVNDAGKLKQKQEVIMGTNFTKPGDGD